MDHAAGMVEMGSIAAGYQVADVMVKAAAVRLITATPVSPGKFLAGVVGDVASVQAAIAAGAAAAGSTELDRMVIANLHTQVRAALLGTPVAPAVAALGVVECATVASTIRSADAAVKAAAVDLLEVRLARGIGGKGYFTLSGDVGSVQAAVAAARAEAEHTGAWLNGVVIPAPHPDLRAHLVAGTAPAFPGPAGAGGAGRRLLGPG